MASLRGHVRRASSEPSPKTAIDQDATSIVPVRFSSHPLQFRFPTPFIPCPDSLTVESIEECSILLQRPRTTDEPSTSATSATALSVKDLDLETDDESAILTVDNVETMFENYIQSPTPPPAVDSGSTQDIETGNSKECSIIVVEDQTCDEHKDTARIPKSKHSNVQRITTNRRNTRPGSGLRDARVSCRSPESRTRRTRRRLGQISYTDAEDEQKVKGDLLNCFVKIQRHHLRATKDLSIVQQYMKNMEEYFAILGYSG